MSLLSKANKEEHEGHKVVILRCSVSHYTRGTTLVAAYELRPVVRWSNPNMLSQWHEDIACFGADGHYDTLLLKDELESGKLYKAWIGNFTKDWETGYVDGYDWVVKQVPEEQEAEYKSSHPLWVEQLRENRMEKRNEQESD